MPDVAASVVVVGGINMDYSVWVDRLARPGETVRGERVLLHPGGKGANQAVAAARAGAATALIGRVGQDDAGRALVSGLRHDGVDVSGLTQDPACPTGVALIVVDSAGRNTITVGAGANAALSIADLEAARALISSVRIGVLCFEIPMAVTLEAARQIRRSGGVVVLNYSPLFNPPTELLPLVDVLVVNEIEGAAVAEKDGSPGELVSAILARGIPRVVLTTGPDGAYFNDQGRVHHIPGHSVSVVDPTAAGDAFLGVLAAELAQDVELPDACRLANAAGALAVTRAGAQPSIPTRDEIEAFLNDREGVNG